MVTRVLQGGATVGVPPDDAGDLGELGDLGTLAAEADTIEGRPAPVDPATQAQAQAADTQAEAAQLVEVLAALALPIVAWKWGQPVADLYGPPQQAAIGRALGAVAVKYGWSVGGAMQAFGPELALAAALAGPVLPMLLANVTKPGAAAAKPEAAQAIDAAAAVMESPPGPGA